MMNRHRSRSRSRYRKRDRRSDSERRPVATANRSRRRVERVEMPNRWSRAREEERHEPREPREKVSRNRWEREQEDRRDSERDSRDSLQPLPRPGFDKDKRLAQLSDDPRYHPGAELGKAQKAAMGIKGLHGRNTASFDPRSTLVRPAMRIVYVRKGHELGANTKPDDVVVVPELICDAGDQSVAKRVLAELKKSEELDPKEIPAVKSLTARMCQYFQVKHEDALVQIRWHPSGGGPAMELRSTGFGNKHARDQVMLHLSLGATCELAFRCSRTGEVLYFPQENGTLMLLGCDVDTKWHAGESKVPSGMNILVSLWGRSRKAVEEEQLASSVSAATKEGPCRDFRFGRCNFGDNCKFSHGEEDKGGCEQIASWPARPSMRVITVPTSKRYAAPVKHDDVIIVPEFFCKEDDWDTYYTLIKEMRQSQANGDRKAEWISWHEGAHLLSQNPTGSATYTKVLERMCQYFQAAERNRGTRFNWYRDGSDWKPFHHDSAAFNEQRAANQNCTIGISFGAPRELAFRHAKTGELIYVPQKNGMLFTSAVMRTSFGSMGSTHCPTKSKMGKVASPSFCGVCASFASKKLDPLVC